jgi:nitroimidazol reductase NimA-like FMN-containing flavoprotein (pyridoxamine 5'-phosphate oxidase superfamily)
MVERTLRIWHWSGVSSSHRRSSVDTDIAARVCGTLGVMQLAGVDPEGQPVLKTLNGVVDEGWVCFHGSPAGEKTSLVGRPVVASVEETVARLPSYFVDAEKACPATTLYRAAQVHGVLQAIEEPVRKARVLQRLMEKLQPEGGYEPLDAQSPMYRAQVNGLLIAGFPLDQLTTKAKLAQNRSPSQRAMILEKLWGRGGPGDARCIELIREANPDTPMPTFLASVEGTVKVALQRALSHHSWVIESEDVSGLTARLNHRRGMVRVKIVADVSQATISYVDSQDLSFDGGGRSDEYEKWMRNLVDSIRSNTR